MRLFTYLATQYHPYGVGLTLHHHKGTRTPHGTSSHRVRLTPHHHKGTNTAWHVIPWGEAYAASPTRNETPQRMAQHNMGEAYAASPTRNEPHNAWRSTTEVGLSCTTDKERNTTTHGAAQHGWGLRCTTDKERNATTHGAAQHGWGLRAPPTQNGHHAAWRITP